MSASPGSVALNFHSGSRSEYLAQYVFSSFGTAIPVPHQEDSGIDLYCTLLERIGRRAWPQAYYSVQVKSTMGPWVFRSSESVQWLIQHPLPIFLCIVQKAEARLLVYPTTPRFAIWALRTPPHRLELIPETGTMGRTGFWADGNTFTLHAPILSFTVQQILDTRFSRKAANVLKFWIDNDSENLLRIRSGIHDFQVPSSYETNRIDKTGRITRGSTRFSEASLELAENHARELLGKLALHYFAKQDVVTAAICSMAVRQLSQSASDFKSEVHIQGQLNKLLGLDSPASPYEGCDLLLKLVNDRLELSE
jgi:hypothetical protein